MLFPAAAWVTRLVVGAQKPADMQYLPWYRVQEAVRISRACLRGFFLLRPIRRTARLQPGKGISDIQNQIPTDGMEGKRRPDDNEALQFQLMSDSACYPIIESGRCVHQRKHKCTCSRAKKKKNGRRSQSVGDL